MAADIDSSSPFRRSFTIEQKTFLVEHKDSTLRLTEHRDKYNSYALFPVSLGEWMSSTVEGAIGKKDGFLSKKEDGDLTINISSKSNPHGRFITHTFISPRIRTGAKFIVCPAGSAGIRWLHLADSVRSVSSHAVSSSPGTSGTIYQADQALETTVPSQAPPRRGRRRRQSGQKNAQSGGSSSLVVKVTIGSFVMSQIPTLIHNFIRLSSPPAITTTDNPQVFRINFKSSTDVTKLGELTTLHMKSCTLEFVVEEQHPRQLEPAWSDITTRVLDLWGLPELAATSEHMAPFTTDFGAFRSLTPLRKDDDGTVGIRVTLDHSDLSLMPQMKYLCWEDDQIPIRIIPVKKRAVRQNPKRKTPVIETPESSIVGMPNLQGSGTRTNNKASSSRSGQAQQWQNLLLFHTQGHIDTPMSPTPPNVPCLVAPPLNDSGAGTAEVSTSPPTFAQVVSGTSPLHRNRTPPMPTQTNIPPAPSTSRIADLNQTPLASPSSPHETSPQRGENSMLSALINVGDILGYTDSEKQLMVNRPIDSLSKESTRIFKEREVRTSRG